MAWSYNSVTVNGKTYSQDTAVTLPVGTRYYNSADGQSGTGTLSAAKTVYYYGYNDLYVGVDGYDPAPYYFCATAGGSPSGSGGWKYMKAEDLPKATYTVSYNANGGSGAPSSQTKTYGVTLTLSSTKPTRSGYTFVGWGTSASDTTADYSSGGSYTANASDTLYAIWKKTITLTYDANGGSGAPSSQYATIYNATTNYKFTLSNTKLTRSGYTFLGWSTSNTATSPSYSAGDSITLSSSDTLYAVWSEHKLTVNYYSNYATYATYQGTTKTVSASTNVLVHSQDFYYDNSYSSGLSDVQNTSYLYLAKIGYTPTGLWGTSTTGGYLADQSASWDTGEALAVKLGKTIESSNQSVNVYPQWKINTYTINYNANADAATGNMPSQTVDWNETFNLSTNAFKREGYKFVGWNACRNKDNTWYVVGQGWLTEEEIADINNNIDINNEKDTIYTHTTTVDLVPYVDDSPVYYEADLDGTTYYLVAHEEIPSGTIVDIRIDSNGIMTSDYFDINMSSLGGDYINGGSLTFTTFEVDQTVNVYEKKLYKTQDELIFDNSWIKGDEYSISEYTMYAVWEISGVVYIDNGTSFEPYLAYIDDGVNWNLYLAYVDDGANWNIIS